MKRFVLLFAVSAAWAQNVGIGTATPHPSARLEIADSVRGFLIPRLTTQQRNAIVNPAHALLIFNVDSFCLEAYDTLTAQWYTIACPCHGRNCPTPTCTATISGPTFACTGDTITYIASGCTNVSYQWTVPNGWTIVSGQGTDTLEVKPDTTDGAIAVAPCNACGCGDTSTSSWILVDSCGAWCVVYGGTGNDEGYNLAIAPNGNIVITGATNSFGAGGYDNYLLYIDHNGNKIWDHTYGTTNDDYYAPANRNVLPLNDRILAGGELLAHGDGVVYAVDYSGNTLWGLQITSYNHTSIIAPYANSQYIVTGYAWTPGLFIVDASGNVQQGYIYTPSCGSDPTSIRQILQLPSGGYMGTFGGRCPTPYRPWMYFMNASLDLVWARRYEIPWNPGAETWDVALWSPTIACGALTYGFACLDTLSNPYLEVYFPNNDVILSGIVVTPQRTLVVCGWTSALAQFGGEDAFIMEVDSTGNILRAYVMGGAGNDRLGAAEIDPYGHIVMVGWTDSYGNGARDVWVVHLPYANWDIPNCANCRISPVTPTISLSMPSSVHTFTRATLSGIQPGGQGNLGMANAAKCP